MRATTFTLRPDPPFSLALTAQVLRRTGGNRIDVWGMHAYRRAIPSADGVALLTVTRTGGTDEPLLHVRVQGNAVASGREAQALVRRLFGLDADIGPFLQTVSRVPEIKPMVTRLKGLRPPAFPGLFESIALAVPFQQVSLEAGMNAVTRIARRLGRIVESAEEEILLFPDAATVADAPVDILQGCGLSVAKAQTLRTAARLVEEGQLTEQGLQLLSSDEASRVLTAVPGIGPWTAAVVLLRGLRRLDVFPRGDSGARRILGVVLARDAPLERRDEEALLEQLGPQRGMLYFYTLAWRRAERGLLEDS